MNSLIRVFIIFTIFMTFFKTVASAQVEKSEDFPISGPNCHDTALRALGLKKIKRYIHNYEMQTFLKERCEVTSFHTGSKQLGIVELVDTAVPMHAFVSFGNGEVLTKDGVLKRTLPRKASFLEMKKLHTDAIESDCHRKNITPCKIEVKYYDCKNVDISLRELEDTFSSLTSSKYSFYNLELRNEFEEVLFIEDFSVNCQKKKNEFQSMVLSFKLANMSSRSKEEQVGGEDFFQKNFSFLNRINCK